MEKATITGLILLNNSEEQRIEHFRVSKSTFNYLYEELRLDLELVANPVFYNAGAASVEKQVAKALYKLASCAEYRVVRNVFGVHKCNVKTVLFKEDDAGNISMNIEKKCKLPQIIGCTDEIHIPIYPPSYVPSDFTYRKGHASIVLQAIVHHILVFRDISCKLPGSALDVTAFKESEIFKNKETIFPKAPKNVVGKDVDNYIIGDAPYLLLPFIMKDYTFAACCVLHNLVELSRSDTAEEIDQIMPKAEQRTTMIHKMSN